MFSFSCDRSSWLKTSVPFVAQGPQAPWLCWDQLGLTLSHRWSSGLLHVSPHGHSHPRHVLFIADGRNQASKQNHNASASITLVHISLAESSHMATPRLSEKVCSTQSIEKQCNRMAREERNGNRNPILHNILARFLPW